MVQSQFLPVRFKERFEVISEFFGDISHIILIEDVGLGLHVIFEMFDQEEDQSDETVAGHVYVIRHDKHFQTSLPDFYHFTADIVVIKTEVQHLHGHGGCSRVSARGHQSVEAFVEESEALVHVLGAVLVLEEEVGSLMKGMDSVIRL